jgi:hypothetical protein
MSAKKPGLILLPWLLLLTTYFAFTWSAKLFGPKIGYLSGYLFYWIVWCYLIPFLILGPAGLSTLFNKKISALNSVILMIPVIIAFLGIPFWPNLFKLTPLIAIVSVLTALVNGTGEELFWRGVYAQSFPDNFRWGYLYPTVMFTFWHLSPLAVQNTGTDTSTFLLGALLMGLCWGYVVWKTKSIRWAVLSHILVNLPWLAGFYFI